MISEEQKFRAETFRIFGIALITPLGKILLDPSLFFREHDLFYSTIYTLCTVVGAVIGFLHIEIARGILDQRGENKWK